MKDKVNMNLLEVLRILEEELAPYARDAKNKNKVIDAVVFDLDENSKSVKVKYSDGTVITADCIINGLTAQEIEDFF